jgi:hypothetical protein
MGKSLVRLPLAILAASAFFAIAATPGGTVIPGDGGGCSFSALRPVVYTPNYMTARGAIDCRSSFTFSICVEIMGFDGGWYQLGSCANGSASAPINPFKTQICTAQPRIYTYYRSRLSVSYAFNGGGGTVRSATLYSNC